MLYIIRGLAGCGKTGEVLRRMRQEGETRPQLLLVPEQASFEMERRFCQENGNQAGRYGEVLSFTRLENRVLSLTGGAARPVLDEGGRLLVMYAALKEVGSSLTVYAMPSQKPEFLDSLLTTMDELKSCCVTGAQLTQIGEETEGLEGEKLRDLGLIFGMYEAMTARGPLDPRDKLTRLAEKLPKTDFFRNRDVYLDGFTDFTPQQGLVLERLLHAAHSVTVTLTCAPEGQEDREGVFAPARKTIAFLRRLAGKGRITVKEETLSQKEDARPAPLAYLEKRLFASERPVYTGPWDGSVQVAALPTPREELRWAAGEIRWLVREEGLRYRDIVLTARSMERYWEPMEGIFAQYEVPVFQSDKTDLLQKPIFTLVTAALDAVTGGYAYEDMFRYLKTGLAGLTLDECDRLENYVLTWDIHGSRWTSAEGWLWHPEGYHRDFDDASRQTLDELNALRLRAITPLEALRKEAKHTIGEQVIALYSFLERIHAPEALEARALRLTEQGEPELASQMNQLWDILCEALAQCVQMLGQREAELSEFSRLLRLLLSRYAVGAIPASLDRVAAGDAQRMANRSCHVLFLLGADDGSIPQVTPGQGLLTDRERALLEDYGLTMPPRMEEKVSREYTIVYTACTQPKKQLFVTWPQSGESGGEKRPSFLVQRLKALFPQAETETVPALSPDRLLVEAAQIPALQATLLEEPAFSALTERLTRAAGWQRGRLSHRVVRQLYGETAAMSASRLDQYKSCHFAYFLRFGLQAKERRQAGFHAPEYGTFVHFILEQVLRAIRDGGGIAAFSVEKVKALTDRAVEAYADTQLGGLDRQTPRFRYLFRRLQRSVQAVVENVTQELRASDFQPLFLELGFGLGQDLPPVRVREAGISLRISGFVDRVDGWVQDDRLYLRVVDYKTGRKSFDLTEIWNGLGLQLLLYLFTLEEAGEPLFGKLPIPAGVLYLPAREAVISGSRDMDEASRQKLIDKELVRQGLLLEDSDVLSAMEHGEDGPRFLPLRVSSRTGNISSRALVSAEQLGRLKRHIQEILKGICREMAAGNIDADPFWRGPSRNACQYCVYFRACQFEERQDSRRWIPTVDNRDFWDWLTEREEGGEHHGRTEDA